MSEHTLDDLATRLAAQGFEVLDETEACPEPETGGLVECRTLTVSRTGEEALLIVEDDGRFWNMGGTYVSDDLLIALSTIRQWQASAEPAPPPAAPVVTITLNREDAVAAKRLIQAADTYCQDGAFYGVAPFRVRFDQAVDAALRGADLAPEGARDGQ